jgi:hypothetical protein
MEHTRAVSHCSMAMIGSCLVINCSSYLKNDATLKRTIVSNLDDKRPHGISRYQSRRGGNLHICTIALQRRRICAADDKEKAKSVPVIPRIRRGNIYIAMGMLREVVMPHNIFLHSNLTQSRKWGATEEGKKRLVRFQKTDTLAGGTSSSTMSEGQSEGYRAR